MRGGVGLLCTGWGAVIVAAGVILGGAGIYVYHRYRKKKLAEAEDAIAQEQLRMQGFLERWNTMGKTLEDSDIPKALNLLKSTQECFDIVCNSLFRELAKPLMLLEDCYICRCPLVSPNQWLDIHDENLQVAENYKAQEHDVVASLKCSQMHMLHYQCLKEMWENKHRHCGICRIEFDMKQFRIVYRKLNDGKKRTEKGQHHFKKKHSNHPRRSSMIEIPLKNIDKPKSLYDFKTHAYSHPFTDDLQVNKL